MWALMAVAVAATCADDTLAELDRTMAEVLEANRNIDDTGFARASALMDAALPCLDEVPSPSLVARVHRTMALRAFVDGRTADARRSLLAARYVDPDWTPPFPEGHPFTMLWTEATDLGGTEAIGSIAPRAWVVDGGEALALPVARGFLLQVRNDDGSLQLTRYQLDRASVPDFGQDRVIDPNEVAHVASVRLLGTGRAMGQDQRVDGTTALEEQRASTLAPAGQLTVRGVPDGRFGAEAHLAVLPNDDVIAASSAPVGLEGHAVALIGGQWVRGQGRAFVRGRLGAMTDTVRAWPRARGGVAPSAWRVWGPSLGAEAGLLSDVGQLDVALDGALAGLTPWRLDLRGGGTAQLAGPAGLRVEGLGRLATQPLLDGDATAGRVNERELRLSVGLDLSL